MQDRRTTHACGRRTREGARIGRGPQPPWPASSPQGSGVHGVRYRKTESTLCHGTRYQKSGCEAWFPGVCYFPCESRVSSGCRSLKAATLPTGVQWTDPGARIPMLVRLSCYGELRWRVVSSQGRQQAHHAPFTCFTATQGHIAVVRPQECS